MCSGMNALSVLALVPCGISQRSVASAARASGSAARASGSDSEASGPDAQEDEAARGVLKKRKSVVSPERRHAGGKALL